MPLPTILKNVQSPGLKRTLNQAAKLADRSNKKFVAQLGEEADGDVTWWGLALQSIESDLDLASLAGFINSSEANVYAEGGKFWDSVVSRDSQAQYQVLWGKSDRVFSQDSVLELFAAICHLLYSNHGRQGPMVNIVKQITGNQNVFRGDVNEGWAAGGATVRDGVIVLGALAGQNH